MSAQAATLINSIFSDLINESNRRMLRLVPTPTPRHTHSYVFPVFEEAKPDVRVVCAGFRCLCGKIRSE